MISVIAMGRTSAKKISLENSNEKGVGDLWFSYIKLVFMGFVIHFADVLL